jgi:paraquat-inducible protein B
MPFGGDFMSKPANKTMIGIFVLGAIALVVIAIVTLGSGKLFKKTAPAVCYFDGSVGGLNVGAPVVFRGVKIGTVKEIAFRFDPKKVSVTIPVFIELEQRRKGVSKEELTETYKQLVERGLKAQLEMQSIVTGQLQVALDFYPDKPAKYMQIDPEYFEIPTVQSPLQELGKKLEKIPIDIIFQKILSAVEGIEKIVNSPDITETVRSINEAAKEIKPLAANLEEAVKDVRKLVQNVDGQVGPLASNLNETIQEAKGTIQEAKGTIKNIDSRIGPLGESLEKTLKAAEVTVIVAQRTLGSIEANLGENSTLFYELHKTLEEVNGLARSIRILADYLERHPESVLWGK